MNEMDQKILYIAELLKYMNVIRFDTDLCKELDIKKQNLVKIKKGKAHFTVQHLYKICDSYFVNPSYLIDKSERVFTKKSMNDAVNERVNNNDKKT